MKTVDHPTSAVLNQLEADLFSDAVGLNTLGEAFPVVYRQLKGVAHRQLKQFGHYSLDTTGLVHEAYLKMADQDADTANDRAHFLAIAARAMRQVLVGAARTRGRRKRGAGAVHVTFDDGLDDGSNESQPDLEFLVLVNDALKELETMDPRLGRLVECRFFAGLTEEETALALRVSVSTVQRDWRRAKAWLRHHLNKSSATEASRATEKAHVLVRA